MGFPLRATAAVTMNDIVHRTISTGDYSVVEDKGMSWASAMVSIQLILMISITMANTPGYIARLQFGAPLPPRQRVQPSQDEEAYGQL